MSKLKDLLRDPLDSNTYLVNADLQDGWMPVGGLCLSMLPEKFQKEWADILESTVQQIIENGAYGKEIHLTGVDGKRLQDFPFAILPHCGQHRDAQKSGAISTERKAELFDGLLESVHGLMSDGSWYDIFREIGMSDEEMRSAGLDLPELKLTDQAVMDVAEYIAGQVRGVEMEDGQTHIIIPLADLTSRFGINLESCGLAEDMVIEELYTHAEITEAEIASGELRVKPDERAVTRRPAMESPVMGM